MYISGIFLHICNKKIAPFIFAVFFFFFETALLGSRISLLPLVIYPLVFEAHRKTLSGQLFRYGFDSLVFKKSVCILHSASPFTCFQI